MQAFEVSDLRLITGLDQRFKSFFDQRRQSTAEHCLLPEQVALGFLFERSFENACACRTDSVRVRQRVFVRPPARILLNGEQGRHATSFAINTSQQVTGTLRGDHNDADARRRHNRLEMNAEPMRYAKNLS